MSIVRTIRSFPAGGLSYGACDPVPVFGANGGGDGAVD
jgi:hypothetical protein